MLSVCVEILWYYFLNFEEKKINKQDLDETLSQSSKKKKKYALSIYSTSINILRGRVS